jgi:predicted GNAT superfamily acetyltransferase
MSASEYTIRECETIDDFKQCIELERTVWKDDDVDIMPVRLYLISRVCNAPTIGAFDQAGCLVGFVHTMVALMNKQPIYHSHMAAVIEGLRHKEIGYRMKLAQRQRAIECGIPLIVWTFDPLQSRNAHFNINKLGVVVRRYEDNYFGEGVSTGFDPQVPTDRVFAEWWVSSPQVEAVLSGKRPFVGDARESVFIPDDYDGVREHSLEDALQWRLTVRKEFHQRLSAGLIVRAFSRHAESGQSRYIFGADDEQFHFKS